MMAERENAARDIAAQLGISLFTFYARSMKLIA
jgi:hypothetical protein